MDLNLGAFSLSLKVKDIQVSLDFYTKLGFRIIGGERDQNWLILKSGDCVIGLFEGMFDKNMLTFNPGWNQSGENTEPFDDVRNIQEELILSGIKITKSVDEDTVGPGYFSIEDPDGNPILFDQHR